LYNVINDEEVGKERKSKWLSIAELGAKFLAQYGADEVVSLFFRKRERERSRKRGGERDSVCVCM
jgi:hypothetical protein